MTVAARLLYNPSICCGRAVGDCRRKREIIHNNMYNIILWKKKNYTRPNTATEDGTKFGVSGLFFMFIEQEKNHNNMGAPRAHGTSVVVYTVTSFCDGDRTN